MSLQVLLRFYIFLVLSFCLMLLIDLCHMHGVITQTKGIFFVTAMRTTNFATFERNINGRKPKQITVCKYRCTKMLGR